MKRTVSNAFTRSGAGFRSPRGSLAAALASMRAVMHRGAESCRLQLEPIAAADAAAAWALSDEWVHTDHDLLPRTVLLVNLGTSARAAAPTPPLAALARRWGIAAEALDEQSVVVDDAALQQILSITAATGLRAVRVEGPIEPRDAAAMIRCWSAPEANPLAAELRALAALEVTGDGTATIIARQPEQAMAVLGENFRHYLAAVCNRSATSFAAPHPDQIEHWLTDGGLRIRPIETEVYSTFIDIGLCPEHPTGPAPRSIIYDLPSGTWHE